MANIDQNQEVQKKDYNDSYSGNEEQGGGFDLKVIWYLILRYKYFLLISIAACGGICLFEIQHSGDLQHLRKDAYKES